MNRADQPVPTPQSGPQSNPSAGYEPPRLTVLGSLADLTAGGSVGEDDGSGYAGASGFLP